MQLPDKSKTIVAIFSIAIVYFSIMLYTVIRDDMYGKNYKQNNCEDNWLVIKEDVFGNTIKYWELKNKSISLEKNSNGIFFLDENENIIHLSGFYTYILVKTNFEEVKENNLVIKKDVSFPQK